MKLLGLRTHTQELGSRKTQDESWHEHLHQQKKQKQNSECGNRCADIGKRQRARQSDSKCETKSNQSKGTSTKIKRKRTPCLPTHAFSPTPEKREKRNRQSKEMPIDRGNVIKEMYNMTTKLPLAEHYKKRNWEL